MDLEASRIPVLVQTATSGDIEKSGANGLEDFLNRRANGIHLNEMTGNPFQADVNYRGYTASPVLGTPQGLSVYLDGVRQNQPFGDVVSWDLIPRNAISTVTLISGSDPLFGLNTLGASVEERPDGLVIHGGGPDFRFRSGTVDSLGDHRLAMAFRIAGLLADAPVVVKEAASAGVSDPAFEATLSGLLA